MSTLEIFGLGLAIVIVLVGALLMINFFRTQWESAEHFDRYMEWRTERGDFAEVLAYFTGEPKITRSELFFS